MTVLQPAVDVAKQPDELTRLVPLRTLQELQDRFADLGRMTVVLCRVDGVPLTRPTWGSRYSELIGDSIVGREEFRLKVAESVTAGELDCLVTCLDGMILYATPLDWDGARLAMLVVGTRVHAIPDREGCVRLADKYQIDAEVLHREAQRINPLRGGTPDSIRRFADAQAHIIATLYGQAYRIERQLADLRALHRLSNLLMGTNELQEVLDLTVRQVVDVMQVKACGIRLLDENTGELVIRAVANLSEDYLRKGPVMLHDSPIDRAAFAGETVYIENAPTDKRLRYPQNALKEGIVSGLSAPMTYRGQTVGVIRVYTAVHHQFSEEETALLNSLGALAAAAIINSRLFVEKARAEVFRRQMHSAAAIQRRMLPAGRPRHDLLDIAAAYDPTLEVSGDFYDFTRLPDGSLGICVADVVGKGMPAALLMASVRALLRAFALAGEDVCEVMRGVNRQMVRDTLPSEFTTMVWGVLPADGTVFTYCNAGHPPPLVLRGDALLELAEGGGIIGIDPQAAFTSASFSLEPADVLVMYTDGVTEAFDFEGKAYGRDRLVASIRRHRDLPAESLAGQLLWDVRRFAGLAEQSDDITIVVAKARVPS